MNDWPSIAIEDLCSSIVDCVNRTAPVVEGPTPYRMIRTTNVRDGFIDLRETRFVDEETYSKWTRRQVPMPGDVILTREAPLGEVGIIRPGEHVFLGQRLVSYRTNPKLLDNRFLLYFLLSEQGKSQVMSFGMGATVAHMRVPDAKKLQVPCPPIETQRRIASILGAYDDLIEVNRRRIAVLEEMARGLFEEWFVHFRFPGHETVPVLDTPNGPLPEGWSYGSFTEVADVLSGGTPKKTKAEYWGGDIPFFTPRDAPSNAWTFDTLANVTVEGVANCNSKLYPENTVFITARGTVGKVALAAVPMAMNQSCYALIGKGYPQRFLFGFTQWASARLQAMSNGAVFDTIIVDTFRKLELPIPPVSLAQAYEEKAAPILEMSRVVSASNKRLAASRDLLLPRLISGQLSVAMAERDLEKAA